VTVILKHKLPLTFLFLIAAAALFAVVPDLISGVTQQGDKISFAFKLQRAKQFKISFASATQEGKKQYNQIVCLGAVIEEGTTVAVMDPRPILNLDSAKKSTVITTGNGDGEYKITVNGRTGLYMSQTSPEVATGFTIDPGPERKFCDFSFVSKSDSSLKCTVRVENIE